MQQMPRLQWVFIVFVSSLRDMESQYGEGRNISVTCLRYSTNHNTLANWPIRETIMYSSGRQQAAYNWPASNNICPAPAARLLW